MDQEIDVSSVASPKQEARAPTGCTEGKRQTSNLRLRWNWVPPSIWSDNMLTALEDGVKGNKWFSLIDKVMKPEVLLHAWHKVRANRGAGGVDNITLKRFESNCFKYLHEIQSDLYQKTYRPKPVRRVFIPKGGGKTRPLGIPTVKDRVIQMALKLVIEPIFENEFHENSFGFRPGRGAKDALRQVDRLLKEGHTHVVDVDFESFFDTIPPDRLMTLVKERISDSRILSLLEMFLEQRVMEDGKLWTPTAGTPQGAVISPLLANIYLNPLDHLISDMGLTMIRYADDFVIVTKSHEEAQAAMEVVTSWATSVGMRVHPEKSKLIKYVDGEGFDFLGYRFERGYRFVRDKSLRKIRDTIRIKTSRTDGRSMLTIIEDLNRTLRGWFGYFKHAHYTILRDIDQMVRRRLRAIYRKREKRPGFGRTPKDHKKWPNSHFAKLGLFTTLGARKAAIQSCRSNTACQSRCRNS